MPDNRCIFCGEIIQEGRQVCPACEQSLIKDEHEAIYDKIIATAMKRLDAVEEGVKAVKRSLTLIAGGHREWQ
jgi:RNA polymerase subunit RPABC4/transcription elongation factor Spt4